VSGVGGGWSADELRQLGDAVELQLATVRRDGSQRKAFRVWVVRAGDQVFVRAVGGRESPWFRGARSRHEGHVSVPGLTADVGLLEWDGSADEVEAVDEAYRQKYGKYASLVGSTVTDLARTATLEVVPRRT
jgi:hypothetical protein